MGREVARIEERIKAEEAGISRFDPLFQEAENESERAAEIVHQATANCQRAENERGEIKDRSDEDMRERHGYTVRLFRYMLLALVLTDMLHRPNNVKLETISRQQRRGSTTRNRRSLRKPRDSLRSVAEAILENERNCNRQKTKLPQPANDTRSIRQVLLRYRRNFRRRMQQQSQHICLFPRNERKLNKRKRISEILAKRERPDSWDFPKGCLRSYELSSNTRDRSRSHLSAP